jgi:hypothetical protein
VARTSVLLIYLHDKLQADVLYRDEMQVPQGKRELCCKLNRNMLGSFAKYYQKHI